MQSNKKTKKQLQIELEAALITIKGQQFEIALLKEIKESMSEAVIILSGLKTHDDDGNK